MNPSTLPPSVVERLQNERARIEAGAFSSSLGVPEMLLAREAGYRVLGQVMGATVYQFGGQWTNPNWRNNTLQTQMTQGISYEMTALSNALSHARNLALSRLGAEAQLLGAQGVVGVRLHLKKPGFLEGNQFEFSAIGTAVKGSGAPTKTPFLSNLSGEETWKLERTGWAPCGFVMGNCAFYQSLSTNTSNRLSVSWLRGQRGNFEIAEYTDAIYQARETALSRLEADAKRCGARGIVGVAVEIEERFDFASSGGSDNVPHEIFSFLAIGTAIRPSRRAESNSIQIIADLT